MSCIQVNHTKYTPGSLGIEIVPLRVPYDRQSKSGPQGYCFGNLFVECSAESNLTPLVPGKSQERQFPEVQRQSQFPTIFNRNISAESSGNGRVFIINNTIISSRIMSGWGARSRQEIQTYRPELLNR